MRGIYVAGVILILTLGLITPAIAAIVNITTSGGEDGFVDRDSVSENLTEIRAGEGTFVSTSSTGRVRLSSHASTTDDYTELDRAYYQFNTSVLPPGAVPTVATVYLYGNTVFNGFNDEVSVALYAFTPATNGTAVASDYSQVGSDALSNSISNATLTTTGYNAFTITDISFIDTTGWTRFSVRSSWDATGTPPTWIASKVCSIYFETNETTGTAKDPYMEVTYYLPPTAAFSANETVGYVPFNVGFTDSSTDSPTNWDWYWSADEVKDSDDQNPTVVFASGTHNARLYVSNAYGGDWENKTAYITASYNTVGAPITEAVVATNSQAVFSATGGSGTGWFKWGARSGSYYKWLTPNQTYTSTFTATQFGSPMLTGHTYYVVACNGYGCGNEVSFTVPNASYPNASSYGTGFTTMLRSGFNATQMLGVLAAPYTSTVPGGAPVTWGMLFFFIFAGYWLRHRDITLPCILAMISGGAIWMGGSALGVPPEFAVIGQGIMYAAIAGIAVSWFSK